MKASAINYLVDAGPLVAYLNKSDEHTEWANKVFQTLQEPLGTTETAVAEAAHLLKNHRQTLLSLVESVETGALVIIPSLLNTRLILPKKCANIPRWIWVMPLWSCFPSSIRARN